MMKEVPCPKCQGHGFISHFDEYSVWAETCSDCGGSGVIMQPMTNGDRIRAMSDEELAEHIWKKCGCPNGKNNITCGYVGDCRDCWIDWIRQPAEGG